MTDIVLIHPKGSFLENAMKKVYLPLSLLTCSVYLIKDYSVKIIDQRIDKNWEKILKSEIKKKPKCIGITVSTGEQISNALNISKFIKKYSNIPIVWGGPHPTILPKQTIENKNIDYVIEGEGEIAFYELIKFLDSRVKIQNVPNLWYKHKNKIKNNKICKFIDLNTLPEIPYHLVDMNKYILSYENKKMLIMESSRGCPKKCKFCFINQSSYQRNWRALTPENLVNKIIYLKDKFKIDGIEFQDLNSFVDIKRINEFSKLLLEKKLNIFWNTCARVDDLLKIDDETLEIMEKSGLKRIGIGIESGSNRILKYINKEITINDIYSLSKRFIKRKIQPYYSFIIGFPTETKKERKATINMIIKLLKENKNAKTSLLHCFRPLPGNDLFDICIKLGLKKPTNLEEWSYFHTTQINYPWISKKDQKEILKLNFLSMFLDKKYEEIDNNLIKLFSKIYRPIAIFRFKFNILNFMIAPKLKEIYIKLK